MRLFKMEFYKIAARPVMNLGFLVIAGFFLLVLYQEADGTRTEINGTVYQGLEAIAQDRSLAREYEGLFTMEKAEDIVERFGFSGYLVEKDKEFIKIREGNFCSQFVTDKLTDFFQTDERPLEFSTGESWENYGKKYVEGNMQFGYTAGWEKLQEIWCMAVLSLNVWMVLMTAPVFSEEYSRKTTEILLPTAYGKSRDIRKKAEAAAGLGILVYLLMTLLLFGMTLAVYGGDGLGAGADMVNDFLMFTGKGRWSVAFFLFLQFLLGMAAVLLNVSITLYLSSKCKRPASAVTAGILLYLLPYGVNQILFHMLLNMGAANYFFGWVLMDVMRIFSFSMPLYLARPDIFSIPSRWLMYIPVIAAVVLVVCVWRGCRNYREYEGS